MASCIFNIKHSDYKRLCVCVCMRPMFDVKCFSRWAVEEPFWTRGVVSDLVVACGWTVECT